MPSGDAEAAIGQNTRAFTDLAVRGDAAGIANMYATDAMFMPPNAPAVRGRDAIRQVWAGLLGSGAVQLTLTTEKVLRSGNLAVEVGRYDFTVTPKGGAAMHDVGKYSVTWRNTNGEWKIAVDIYNSDLPATAPH
jgi:uncharacterized protein (TIGR02246 family)